ncbi:hypothetical protein OUS_1424 [Helicobacter pylori R056a]|uniref:Uncharacterized protein n=1 Tax=Helicobacter pylori R018c TaxID=1145110 RepID=K2KP99_HELPX|nr:hypothetical protein [Helicobacter pylori]EKE79395.1 hypothetical protein OUC_1357 [Helicobacter pylori R018c]EKE93807.1 hypothetical protein OUS_1424 [Helicobacter pylori R056a]
MKALKIFLKKSLILLLAIALNHLNAVAMIVDNPTQNAWNGAKRAWDESKWAKHLATITERIKLAQDTLDRANQTLNSINKANDVLNKTNQFMNGSILNIPNPMGLVENATQIAKNVKSNALALQESAKNYNLAEKFLLRNIASKCPELDMNKINPKTKEIFFSDKGKEKSAARQALENLANALGNTQITTTQDITTSLSGRVLADFICKTKERELLEIKKQQYLAQAQTCLISKNFQCYGNFLSQSKQIDLKIFKEAQARTFKLFSSLQNRGASFTQELSVKNPIYAKEGYCSKQNIDGKDYCFSNTLEIERLINTFEKDNGSYIERLKGATNQETKAKVYADFKQKFEMLNTQILLNIANNLNFMNQTLSLMASAYSDTYYKQQNIIMPSFLNPPESVKKEFLEINKKTSQAFRANLNKFGLPTSQLPDVEKSFMMTQGGNIATEKFEQMKNNITQGWDE